MEESEAWKSKGYLTPQGMRKESVLTLDAESPLSVESPVIGEKEEVWYNYRCKRCGQEWSEKAFQVVQEQPEAGYKGD